VNSEQPRRRSLLDTHEILQRKLQDFDESYGLIAIPALVWQCSPTQTRFVDRLDSNVANALREGANRDDADDGWWRGFKSDRAVQVTFEGLAAFGGYDEDLRWATEVHTDGHIMAGLWYFPDGDLKGTAGKALHDFHANAFRDFASIMSEVMAATGSTYPASVTCTLVNAQGIGFHKGRNGERLLPSPRAELQRQVRIATSAEELLTVGEHMGVDLLAAYGVRRR
jgi:hypothetical protein